MSLAWMDHDWCPLLHVISIHGGAGIAVRSESLEKTSKTLTKLHALEIANPFSLSFRCSELAQTLIVELFQERLKKKVSTYIKRSKIQIEKWIQHNNIYPVIDL